MDWNGTFASRPQPTLNSHYDYSYDQCPDQQGQKQLQRSREDHNCLLERSFQEGRDEAFQGTWTPTKANLQVMKYWKGMLVQQATREQVVSTVDTKISGEETVESTSVPGSNKTTVAASPHVPIPECNYVFNLLTGGAKLPSYP
ncbi:hypothetical protein Goklo_018352 [Gossypium klotzschianum]|uniref:Uncharacterized protein n=1 Tax=Gossypium klotzschianum TaxID=34286 RepID=A0A7J8UL31_9ROSI|nr:hypothetical protein [Gossypium klotzschianum]